jgi:hypothetical protein
MKQPNKMMLTASIACLGGGVVLYILGQAGFARQLTATNMLQIIGVSLLLAFFAFAVSGNQSTNT